MKPANLALVLLPLSLCALFFFSHPFSDTLTSKTFSLSVLNQAQKNNIEVAARALDSIVIKPQETFSFNRSVGPRTNGRGYRPALSYLGPESPTTTGGGICLLSSAIYQAALESGLTVVERVPHLRTMRTVEPGLDATVWYGAADLKIKNNRSTPIQIEAKYEPRQLTLRILGKRSANETPAKISTFVCQRTQDKILVEVLQHSDNASKRISKDLYCIAN
ncbi:MAG: VanW family protein [Candidatus Obscuribacterales bacterium]|nr:VanW family protein [Candidatus Obscuribacterales bacterium]